VVHQVQSERGHARFEKLDARKWKAEGAPTWCREVGVGASLRVHGVGSGTVHQVAKGASAGAVALNKLFYGDNLEVLRQSISAETVDLAYLDPPFQSNRSYNVIFNRHDTAPTDDSAQIQAFDDTWVWTPVTEQQFSAYVGGELPGRVADALSAFRTLLGENDAMAYLVNMAPRLVELHRVLRLNGSLYLHCDSVMSHYLKVLLDAIFGAANFRDEIIWQRHNARSVKQAIYPRLHDVILYYGKSDRVTFNTIHIGSGAMSDPHDIVTWSDGLRYRTKDLTAPETRQGETGQTWEGMNPTTAGRHWRVGHSTLDLLKTRDRLYYQQNGMPRERAEDPYVPTERTSVVGDVWTDINSINSGAAERLGYPTQKPLALLERIIETSSNPGDVVLDAFCGCGTAVDAAQKLARRWVGVDITYISIDLIEKRLQHTYGEEIKSSYEVLGIPKDRASALALFSRSPFDFERWAVSLVYGQPNQKQVGDKGIDGVARFPLDARKTFGRALISVKGGKQLNPSMVRDLGGTVTTQGAEMGILITNGTPTRGMKDEANHAGSYQHPHFPEAFPRIQIITVDDLLSGRRPKMPPTVLPYIQALQSKTPADQGSLFDE